MQLRRFSRYFAQILLVTGAISLVMGGCSRQGEGERCDRRAAGDSDCDDGLYCRACEDLDQGPVDRCCRRDGTYKDERCIPGHETVCYRTDDGTGGTTTSSGDAGASGADSSEQSGGSGGTGATAGTGATGATGAVGGSGASAGAAD